MVWQLKALCKTSLGCIGIVVLSLVSLFETHFPQNIQQWNKYQKGSYSISVKEYETTELMYCSN